MPREIVQDSVLQRRGARSWVPGHEEERVIELSVRDRLDALWVIAAAAQAFDPESIGSGSPPSDPVEGTLDREPWLG
jgi:hypothetical protein